MRLTFKAALLSLLISPSVLAFPVGGYFQQAVIVDNTSTQAIMVTDATSPELQNKVVNPGFTLQMAFASDQFTQAAGQTFGHTVSIHSAVNFALICTVTNSIQLSANGMSMNRPNSSNEAHCKATNVMTSGSKGTILGMEVTVQ